MKMVTVVNRSKAVTIGTQIGLANGFLTRLVGLIGKTKLNAGCGILIKPSSGVHTFGMLFPIDVVALDRKLQVVGLWHRLRPFRLTRISFRTHSVLELGPGEIQSLQIAIGDQLEVV